MDFRSLADVSNLTATAGDLLREPRGLFALGAVAVLVLYGVSVGRTKALVSLLSIYIAYVLTVLFPFLPWLRSRVPEQAQAGLGVAVFLGLYLVVFMALSRSLARSRLSVGEVSLFQVLLISAVQVGLLTSIGASLLPPETSQQLLGPAQPYIAGPRALWTWAAASLLILPLLRSRRRRD